MVEALRTPTPLAITTATKRYNLQHHSYRSRTKEGDILQSICCNFSSSSDIKPNSWCAQISAPNFLTQLKKPQISSEIAGNLIIDVNKVANLEVNRKLPEKKGNFGEGFLEINLPPKQNLEFQTVGVSRSSRVSKKKVNVSENGLQYLEERDESILSKRILSLSRSNKIASAVQLYRSMEFSGLQPDLHSSNSLLSCLLRKKMLDQALEIFERMKENGVTTGHTYSLILKAVAASRGCDAALAIFEELVVIADHKKDFDVVVYNTMISACAKMNNWVHTERIWRSLRDNGHIGTIVTYRMLVCIFVRCNQNELALDAYHEMVQNGLKPTDDAMRAVIGACAKEGKWDMAMTVFENMLESGFKPNAICCNALINALGKAGKVKRAFRVYEIMKSLGFVPDSYTWKALIGALYRANRHQDAIELFDNIQKEQVSVLNLHMYNTVLMCCQRLGLWHRALQIIWQMEDSGMSVPTSSYNLVIGACEFSRRPKIAAQVYEHMVHQNKIPDTFTLLSLIRIFVWGSLWNEVDKILHRGEADGSLYNAAIQGMCLRRKLVRANNLYMEMQKLGLKPDGKTRALMLQNLANSA